MSVIIAIAGGSCSGKTTLARHLQRRLGMDEAMLIRQDDYYFDIRERAASGARDSGAGMPNFDVPEALDFALLADDLERLKFAQDVEPAHIKYIRPSKAHADIVLEQEDYMQSIDSVMERIIDAIPTDASAEIKP